MQIVWKSDSYPSWFYQYKKHSFVHNLLLADYDKTVIQFLKTKDRR